ncbi:MAG: GDSL-type esterase/lipase family protein [Verrucomicrobia bacterium]|nr:GDSL-type esterase/lipase family protein [Verrucomicrobiota bacterium]
MRIQRLVAAASFALLLAGWPLGAPGAEQAPAEKGPRYEAAFAAFAEADRASPPAPGGILFVGSSIFRQWTTVAEQMKPLPVLNRAFGGSRTADQLVRFEQLVPRYAPKVIVYYCGSNDVRAGTEPEAPAAIFARFREFSERAQRALPGVRVVFVSSTRSPDRVARWEQVDHYNALARAYCESHPGHTFVDINPLLVDADGHPRLDLYRADKLHFHPPAYELFTARLKPVLERIWAEVGPARSGP